MDIAMPSGRHSPYIMADALMAKTIGGNKFIHPEDKLRGIETYIFTNIKPLGHELYTELLVKPIKRINEVEVD